MFVSLFVVVWLLYWLLFSCCCCSSFVVCCLLLLFVVRCLLLLLFLVSLAVVIATIAIAHTSTVMLLSLIRNEEGDWLGAERHGRAGGGTASITLLVLSSVLLCFFLMSFWVFVCNCGSSYVHGDTCLHGYAIVAFAGMFISCLHCEMETPYLRDLTS